MKKATPRPYRITETRKMVIKAQKLYDEGRYEQACLLFSEVYIRNDRVRDIQLRLGKTLFQLNRITDAIQILREAITRNPHDYRPRLCLADAYRRTDDYTSAEYHLQYALSFGKKSSAEVYFALGIVHKEQGHYGLAQGFFENTLALDETVLEAYLELVKIHLYYRAPEHAEMVLSHAEKYCGADQRINKLKDNCALLARQTKPENITLNTETHDCYLDHPLTGVKACTETIM